MKIYKTRSGTPYLPNGKTRFNLRNTPAVYIIYSGNKIAYIGSGVNAYKSFYRHFQDWRSSKQRRVTFGKFTTDIRARFIYTKTLKDAREIEQSLLNKFQTLYNNNQIDYEATPKEKQIVEQVTFEEAQPIITELDNFNLPF